MRRATLKQTESSLNTATYTVQENGATLYEIRSNYIDKNILMPIQITSAGNETEIFSLHRNIPRGLRKGEQCNVMDFYAGDEKLGSVWQNVVRIHGLVTYTVQWQERLFTVYPVALGRQGFKLPVYEHDTQVALVEKGNVVLHLLDVYELYTQEDDLLSMVVLFACFYDRKEHAHAGKAVSSSKEYAWALSLNPQEREQYHAEWVTPFLSQEEQAARAKIAVQKLPPQWVMTFLSWLPVLLLAVGLVCIVLFFPAKRIILLPVGILILWDIVSRYRKRNMR